ncbi:DinB family protein [Deinococcus oregonensis]|uniref:DinB family protein n=1 Tax=Deinococcus oregonensis TaxID=1805970 RepID=A0ABV6ASH8_9DEIO
MNLLDRLLKHDAWTTGRLIEQSRWLSDAQLDQEFDLGWRTVRATLNHLVENMEGWTDLMTGLPDRHPQGAPQVLQTLDALQMRLEGVIPQLAAVAHQKDTHGQLDDLWTLRPEPLVQLSYGGSIAHVITHSMHHRAQLIHMLKRLGVQNVIEGDVLTWEEQARGTAALP